MEQKTESPCIRSCCLDGNDICLGCHRTLNEILNWAKSPEEDKQLIIAKCESRKRLSENNRQRER
jgi:predicted Fe-S protein YdhL (DUF1289 family)